MVAVTVAFPAVPKVTLVDALPAASVGALAGLTVAFVAVNVTRTPAMGWEFESSTSTANGVVKAAPGAPEVTMPGTALNLAGVAGSLPPKSNLARKPSPRGNAELLPA